MDCQTVKERRPMRDSGIELLKVVAICLIVISHVVQTLGSENSLVGYSDYVLNYRAATTNIQLLLLALMRHFGALGNNIFFIASAWFLLDSKKSSKQKMMEMIVDIWVISVLILGATFVIRGGVSFKLIVHALFPTTFANNWYMTCYLLFYAVHPFLNRMIDSMTQKELLRIATVMAILYIGCNFVLEGLFFSGTLILWTTIYLIVAYVKFNWNETYSSVKFNGIVLLLGITGSVGLVLLLNFLGLRGIALSNTRWAGNYNFFLMLIAWSLFGLARTVHFKNKTINNISRCSMLIYIIHENVLVLNYLRPYIWHLIYTRFGYAHVLLWVFVFAAGLFLTALLLSLIYEKTIQRLTKKLSVKLLTLIRKLYSKYETMMLKVH